MVKGKQFMKLDEKINQVTDLLTAARRLSDWRGDAVVVVTIELLNGTLNALKLVQSQGFDKCKVTYLNLNNNWHIKGNGDFWDEDTHYRAELRSRLVPWSDLRTYTRGKMFQEKGDTIDWYPIEGVCERAVKIRGTWYDAQQLLDGYWWTCDFTALSPCGTVLTT